MISPARPMRWLLVAALAYVLPAPLLGQTRWREISSRPDSASLARFQTGFPDCGPSGRPANDEGSRLYEHIAHGNAYALQAALSQLGCFDGGEMEDLFIAIGTHFDRSPRRVVSLVVRYKIDERVSAIIVTMIPPNVTTESTLNTLYQARLRALEGIREPEYARTVKVWSDELRAALAP
jgi:hypothetical protein